MSSSKPQAANPAYTLELRRTFSATLEKVFAAWARPDQLARWMCKDAGAHTVIHHRQDIRTGGDYLIEVRDPEKNEIYWGRGTYVEVRSEERIVFTWSWTKGTPDGESLHPDSGETRVRVEFFARGKSTEVVLNHESFGSVRDRDDHNQGWSGCFDVLAGVLGQA